MRTHRGEGELRLIREEDILRRIKEDIDKRKDSTDIIDRSVVAGLNIAYCDVLLCETVKEARK